MPEMDFSVGGGRNSGGGGGGMKQIPNKHKGPRFTWNTEIETTFFSSLCDSVRRGLREGSTFKPEAWDRALHALAEKHGAVVGKNHLINKSDNARKKFRLWRSLRENPEFTYNPETRMVTATEDAWNRHCEKEALAKQLRDRSFDHEEYLEILFPDVIGSGGAPKRIIKPQSRKKGSAETEEQVGFGQSNVIINGLLGEVPFVSNPTTVHQAHPSSSNTPIPIPIPIPIPSAPVPVEVSRPVPALVPPPTGPPRTAQQRRPTSTILPPSTAIIPDPSAALTPPEELHTSHARKRFPENISSNNNTANGTATGTSNNPDANKSTSNPPDKRRRTATGHVELLNKPIADPAENGAAAAATFLADVLRAAAQVARPPSWSEQALDLFFRDFGEEDLDLQLRISEKMLVDENKALVFCKMPPHMRQHWVKRLREISGQYNQAAAQNAPAR